MDLDPREVVVLRMVAADPGRSQRSLGPASPVRASHLDADLTAIEGKALDSVLVRLARRPGVAEGSHPGFDDDPGSQQ